MNKLPLSLLLFFLVYHCTAQNKQSVQDIQLTNISQVNTGALEFSPVFYHQGLVYISSDSRHGLKDRRINENTFDLFYADLGPKGKLSKPAPLSLKVNTKFHEGPVCFSQDMSTMYYTRNNLVNGKPIKDDQGWVQLKIYQATRGKEDWENIKDLPFNNDQYSCIHPSMSPDGKRLYFASDRPGGFGGMDIYYSELNNGNWSEPVNLGPSINTSRTEAFPYIHSSGKLFFASNRQYGLGGLDIYMVDVTQAEPGTVIQLPEPINSFQDDLGFIINNDGKVGYFSSNRAGGKGKDDLYRADIPNGLEGLFNAKEIDWEVLVKNKNTEEVLSSAFVKAVELPASKTAYSLTELFNPVLSEDQDGIIVRYYLSDELIKTNAAGETNPDGQHTIRLIEDKVYVVAATKAGFQSNFVQINTFDTSKKQTVLYLSPVEEEIIAPPTVTIEVGTVFILDQIFYDFDKSYIRTDASRGLDAILTLMNQYPDMRIDLTAHTDCRGNTKYNQKLSELRVNSAKYFLTSRGIAEDRINAIGMGERDPRNGCIDGVKCSETEHQYNRRTEIKVTSLGALDEIEYINNLPDYIDVPRGKKKQ